MYAKAKNSFCKRKKRFIRICCRNFSKHDESIYVRENVSSNWVQSNARLWISLQSFVWRIPNRPGQVCNEIGLRVKHAQNKTKAIKTLDCRSLTLTNCLIRSIKYFRIEQMEIYWYRQNISRASIYGLM